MIETIHRNHFSPFWIWPLHTRPSRYRMHEHQPHKCLQGLLIQGGDILLRQQYRGPASGKWQSNFYIQVPETSIGRTRRPAKELKAFVKVALVVGQQRVVTVVLDKHSVSIFFIIIIIYVYYQP